MKSSILEKLIPVLVNRIRYLKSSILKSITANDYEYILHKYILFDHSFNIVDGYMKGIV